LGIVDGAAAELGDLLAGMREAGREQPRLIAHG
jgi:hypothetical protein